MGFGSSLRPGHGLSRYCTTSEYGPFPISGKTNKPLLKKIKNLTKTLISVVFYFIFLDLLS